MLAIDVASDFVEQALLLFGVLLGPSLFIGMTGYHLLHKGQKLLANRRHRLFLRSLPCIQCQYLSDSEWLPCAVQPSYALTDAAKNCLDFARSSAECSN